MISGMTPERREFFLEKLQEPKYGLAAHEIDLLVARLCDEKTFAEITEEQGWKSVGVAYSAYRDAKEKLFKLITRSEVTDA